MSAVHDIPDLDAKGLRRFAISTSAILVALFGVALPWLLERRFPLWPWIIAAVLVLWGLGAPGSLGPLYRAWMRFGLLMNRIVSPIVLGAVFFVVITPAALAMKALRRDPMARGFDRATASYRVPSEKAPRERMERPY